MSLLKGYNSLNTRKRSEVQEDFLLTIDKMMAEPQPEDETELCLIAEDTLLELVQLYAEYSVSYLRDVAQTLTEPKDANNTMKFMNSYIAEVTNRAGVHYFNAEQGYSIIDKAVQLALDNNGLVTHDEVQDIINDIEESYVEETEEE